LGMVNGHGQHTTSVSSLSGDITPRYDARNGSVSRPASRAAHTATNTSDANASSGYPAPIGSQR
jgi:hypothetical protein